MRRLKLIGIGAGNPDHITLQAVNALGRVNIVFVTVKGEESAELQQTRRAVCERHMHARPYRVVEIRDAERDRSPAAYRAAVTAWHEQRAALYERVIREEMTEDDCGAFLVWGDPALYDSTLRIIERVAAMSCVEFDWEIIPGISSIQALAASHRISWNDIGAPVHITTGRLLSQEGFEGNANTLVLLDGHCAFKDLVDTDVDIFWGAYLGTPDEILISGRLSEVGGRIESTRAEARNRKGWIMDTYLLVKKGAS